MSRVEKRQLTTRIGSLIYDFAVGFKTTRLPLTKVELSTVV